VLPAKLIGASRIAVAKAIGPILDMGGSEILCHSAATDLGKACGADCHSVMSHSSPKKLIIEH